MSSGSPCACCRLLALAESPQRRSRALLRILPNGQWIAAEETGEQALPGVSPETIYLLSLLSLTDDGAMSQVGSQIKGRLTRCTQSPALVGFSPCPLACLNGPYWCHASRTAPSLQGKVSTLSSSRLYVIHHLPSPHHLRLRLRVIHLALKKLSLSPAILEEDKWQKGENLRRRPWWGSAFGVGADRERAPAVIASRATTL